MKRFLPVAAAGIVFLLSLAMLRPEPTRKVVVAAADLPAGWTIRPEDVALQEVPQRMVPADALANPDAAVGKTVRISRAKGDILRESVLGAPVVLGPDERAIGVKVSDASGLAGSLQPGMRMGVVAVIFSEMGRGAFSKVTVEGLRVLYVSPEFAASVPEPPPSATGGIPLASLRQRRPEGTVVLAVPTKPMPVRYVADGREEERSVNALELLAALNAAQNAALSLYVAPGEGIGAIPSQGLFLEELVPSGVLTQTWGFSR